MEYKDHALEQDFHSTLHKAKRYSRKKKKHLKDDSRWVESNKYLWDTPRKRSLCGCERCKDNMQHKHFRAKRMYVEEECSTDFDYLEWFDHDGDYGFTPTEHCNGNHNCTFGTCMRCDWDTEMYGLLWDDDYFIEWWDYPDYWYKKVKSSSSYKQYLGANGEVLFNKIDAHSISPVEIKDYNYCVYCENHHFYCECFE